MADHIAGRRQVLLATDTASRRALRSVGKVAATTGDTIHLDPAATGGSRLNTVIAHELTHIASPSPVPRFFDDVVDSPEERRADATARVMARSPLAPTSSVLTAPGAATRTVATDRGGVVRRTPSDTTPHSAPGVVSAESLAASITRSGSAARRSASTNAQPAGDDLIRRLDSSEASPRRPAIGGHRARGSTISQNTTSQNTVSQSTTSQNTTSQNTAPGSPAPFDPDSEAARTWFLEQLERHTDTIVRLLTDQIVVDLERRGGRLWGGI